MGIPWGRAAAASASLWAWSMFSRTDPGAVPLNICSSRGTELGRQREHKPPPPPPLVLACSRSFWTSSCFSARFLASSSSALRRASSSASLATMASYPGGFMYMNASPSIARIRSASALGIMAS